MLIFFFLLPILATLILEVQESFPRYWMMAPSLFSFLKIVSLLFSTTLALPSFPRSTLLNANHGSALPAGSEGNETTPAGLANSALESRDLTFLSCDGSKYRDNLKVISCQGAVARIPEFSLRLRYALRGYGRYEVSLPSRFISCKYWPQCCLLSCVMSEVRRMTNQHLMGCVLSISL